LTQSDTSILLHLHQITAKSPKAIVEVQEGTVKVIWQSQIASRTVKVDKSRAVRIEVVNSSRRKAVTPASSKSRKLSQERTSLTKTFNVEKVDRSVVNDETIQVAK